MHGQMYESPARNPPNRPRSPVFVRFVALARGFAFEHVEILVKTKDFACGHAEPPHKTKGFAFEHPEVIVKTRDFLGQARSKGFWGVEGVVVFLQSKNEERKGFQEGILRFFRV